MYYGGKSPANSFITVVFFFFLKKEATYTHKTIGNMHGYYTGCGNCFSIWKYCPDQTCHLAEIKDIPVIQPYQKSWSNVYMFDKMCLQQTKESTHANIFLKKQTKKAYFKLLRSFLNVLMNMVLVAILCVT